MVAAMPTGCLVDRLVSGKGTAACLGDFRSGLCWMLALQQQKWVLKAFCAVCHIMSPHR